MREFDRANVHLLPVVLAQILADRPATLAWTRLAVDDALNILREPIADSTLPASWSPALRLRSVALISRHTGICRDDPTLSEPADQDGSEQQHEQTCGDGDQKADQYPFRDYQQEAEQSHQAHRGSKANAAGSIFEISGQFGYFLLGEPVVCGIHAWHKGTGTRRMVEELSLLTAGYIASYARQMQHRIPGHQERSWCNQVD